MDYIEQVNSAFGIDRPLGVLPILQDLYGTSLPVVIGEARDGRLSAQDFVGKVSREFGIEAGDATRIRYQASLVNYAREEMGEDPAAGFVVRGGSVYSELEEGGVMRLSVGAAGPDGRLPFEASVADGATLKSGPAGGLPDDADFRLVASASDIEDVVVAFNQDYVPTVGARLV